MTKIKIDDTITIEIKLQDSPLNKEEISLIEFKSYLEYLWDKCNKISKLAAINNIDEDSSVKQKEYKKPRKKRNNYSEEDIKEMIKMFDEGRKKEIMVKWNLSESAVYNRVKYHQEKLKNAN